MIWIIILHPFRESLVLSFFSFPLSTIFRFPHFCLLSFTHFSLHLAPVLSLSWILLFTLWNPYQHVFSDWDGIVWSTSLKYHDVTNLMHTSHSLPAEISCSVLVYDSETPLALVKSMNLLFLVMIDLLGSALPITKRSYMWRTARFSFSTVEVILYSFLAFSFLLLHKQYLSLWTSVVLVESTILPFPVWFGFNQQSVGHRFLWSFQDLFLFSVAGADWKESHSIHCYFDDWGIQRHLERECSRICNRTSHRRAKQCWSFQAEINVFYQYTSSTVISE